MHLNCPLDINVTHSVSADGSGKKSKKQKKLSKAEMLQEAEKQTAEREALAASSEGQVRVSSEAAHTCCSTDLARKDATHPSVRDLSSASIAA